MLTLPVLYRKESKSLFEMRTKDNMIINVKKMGYNVMSSALTIFFNVYFAILNCMCHVFCVVIIVNDTKVNEEKPKI